MYHSRKKTDLSLPKVTKEEAGYCSFLVDYDKSDSNEKVSKKTKRKVYATKTYICQYQKDLWNYLYHRALRLESMEKHIQSQLNWTKEERRNYRNEHFIKESQYLRLRRVRTSLKEFAILARLGKGGYGDVYLCRKIDTGEVLALKRMKKSRFTDRNEVLKVRQEREVMVKSNSPWLAKLMYCFQSNEYLYMAMEYIPGGDIKNLLDQLGCISEEHARFFFAEMLLAVDDLHKLGYIHRDLKPDNFMIDKSGHVKLIDFGLSKEGVSRKVEKSSTRELKRRESTAQRFGWSSVNIEKGRRNRLRKVYSIVGSPEYMAIEVLSNKGYTHLVDYWSLGVILYELIYGVTPFVADTVKEVFENVRNWKEKLRPPPFTDEEDFPVSPEFWSLIKQLITEQENRLQNISQIQAHEWFRGFRWDKIREMDPPFVPDLKHEVDTSYFPVIDDRGKSIDLLVSRQLNNNPLKEGKLTKVYSFKDNKNTINGDHKNTIKLENTEKDIPKIKFNQSYSKFDFAGFTFQHEDLNLMIKKCDPSRSKINNRSSLPRFNTSSHDKKSSRTSMLIKSVDDMNIPEHLDRKEKIVISDESSSSPIAKLKKKFSRSKKKKGYDSEGSMSPRESSSESINEDKEKKRPKRIIPIERKYKTYRNERKKSDAEEKGRSRAGTTDMGVSDEEIIRIRKTFKRRSEGRLKKKRSEDDKALEESINYIQMIQRSLRKRPSFVEGKNDVDTKNNTESSSSEDKKKKKAHSRKSSKSSQKSKTED